jgi:hypothetical protein
MIPTELSESLKPIKRMYQLLWVSLTAAIFLYLLVLVINSDQVSGTPSTIDPIVTGVLVSLGGLLGVGSLLYHSYMQSESYLQRMMSRDMQPRDIEEKAWKMTPQNKRDAASVAYAVSKLALLTPFDRRRYALAADGFLHFVLNLALNEAVALFGFVIAILSRDLWSYLPFGIAAIALNVYMRPRLEGLMERCESWRTAD